ncbi:5-hydroxyisourate hydrolase, partial [Leucoagaricus sp. SymC.cos]
VLDASTGKPAEGVKIILQVLDPSTNGEAIEVFQEIAEGVTNSDGRCIDLLPPRGSMEARELKTDPEAGQTYKIIFKTKPYFARTNRRSFYPWVEIFFNIENPSEHYHIPLLICPYSFTTYRGS